MGIPGLWTTCLLYAALLGAAITALPAQTPEGPIAFIGAFSNVRFTQEHAYGYSVELWRQGDELFGLFNVSEGLAGDTPVGILEDVTFDRVTGKLSFKARLTIGVRMLPGTSKWSPSKDLFELQGTLDKAALVGTVKRSDLLVSAPRLEILQVRLPRVATTAPISECKSYAEWRKVTAEVLKLRGPEW